MNIRTLTTVCMLALFIAAAAPLQSSAQSPRFPLGKYRVGAHVLGDPMAMNKWIACTITAVHPSIVQPNVTDSYSAKCANGIEYTLIADADHVKPGGGGALARVPAKNRLSTANPYAVQLAGGYAARYHRVNTGSAPLRAGVYHCIAGFSTMLTYGDLTISGNSFTFRAPDGSGGSGTYTADANGGLHWSGNFGVLSRPPWVIESSNKQQYVPDAISFYYHRADGIHRSMSCRRR
jgi:hypothetical protein